MLGLELAFKQALEKALDNPEVKATIEGGKAQLQQLVTALAGIEKNTSETLRLTTAIHERIFSDGGRNDSGDGQRALADDRGERGGDTGDASGSAGG